jgi:hypothetical protein
MAMAKVVISCWDGGGGSGGAMGGVGGTDGMTVVARPAECCGKKGTLPCPPRKRKRTTDACGCGWQTSDGEKKDGMHQGRGTKGEALSRTVGALALPCLAALALRPLEVLSE